MTRAQTERASAQGDLYEQATTAYGAALGRLARAYEANPEKRRDLVQDIHLALCRSFGSFARVARRLMSAVGERRDRLDIPPGRVG